MSTIVPLTQQAIQASSEGNWAAARDANTSILEQEPHNTAAMNRLAFCYLQLGESKEAKKLYEQVLEIERFNPIATKYLSLIKQKVQPKPVSFSAVGGFIEEPGKTKSLSLGRLADPDVVQSIAVATECKLVPKNHRVNVQTMDGTYLGAIPDDVAFRLQKLIASGNTYAVFVQSTSKKHCTVFIKETFRSPSSAFATSFPLAGTGRSGMAAEDVMLDTSPLEGTELAEDTEIPEQQEEEFPDITD